MNGIETVIMDIMSDALGVTKSYEASPIKRARATKADVGARRTRLLEIIREGKPMTVRQVFYQATVHGIVEKAETGYAKVQTDLVKMRGDGILPYGWLTDSTRWQRRLPSFNSVEQALEETARFYRKNLWAEANSYVEIWLEKDALSGVILPITQLYDVPLMVARGYASLSFLHAAGEAINELSVPAFIYHLGDFDPSGVNAGEKIEQKLREFAPAAEIHFERLAVTPQQIQRWSLPTRPTKASDTRSKGFGDISVELDAIRPADLRDIVELAIMEHLPPRQFSILKEAEASEREVIMRFVNGWSDAP